MGDFTIVVEGLGTHEKEMLEDVVKLLREKYFSSITHASLTHSNKEKVE